MPAKKTNTDNDRKFKPRRRNRPPHIYWCDVRMRHPMCYCQADWSNRELPNSFVDEIGVHHMHKWTEACLPGALKKCRPTTKEKMEMLLGDVSKKSTTPDSVKNPIINLVPAERSFQYNSPNTFFQLVFPGEATREDIDKISALVIGAREVAARNWPKRGPLAPESMSFLALADRIIYPYGDQSEQVSDATELSHRLLQLERNTGLFKELGLAPGIAAFSPRARCATCGHTRMRHSNDGGICTHDGIDGKCDCSKFVQRHHHGAGRPCRSRCPAYDGPMEPSSELPDVVAHKLNKRTIKDTPSIGDSCGVPGYLHLTRIKYIEEMRERLANGRITQLAFLIDAARQAGMLDAMEDFARGSLGKDTPGILPRDESLPGTFLQMEEDATELAKALTTFRESGRDMPNNQECQDVANAINRLLSAFNMPRARIVLP